MFPSNSNNNLHNSGNELVPVSYSHVDQSLFDNSRPFLHDTTILTPNSNSNITTSNLNPNFSKQLDEEEENPHRHHHPPLSFFYFPSPFEDDDVLLFQQHHHHDLLLHSDSQVPLLPMREVSVDKNTLANDHQTTITAGANHNSKMVDWDSSKNHDTMKTEPQIPRRRSCKRDRHSKINTARGPRDRRMRLSLEVARKFFGLQDVLGFDKASKTVEWLLIQAESEIKKLAKDHQHLNYKHMISSTKSTSPTTSESCEVISGIDEAATNITINLNGGNDEEKLRSRGIKPSSAKKRNLVRRQLSRKSSLQPLAKASREKARARARERTIREKMQRQVVDDDQSKKPCDDQANGNRLSSRSPFETGEESVGTQSHNNMNITATHDPNSLEALTYHHHEVQQPISSSQAGDQDLVVDHGITHDSLGFMGKWSPSSTFSSLLQNTGIPQEHHQFADFQLFGKPWEVYNNTHNLF